MVREIIATSRVGVGFGSTIDHKSLHNKHPLNKAALKWLREAKEAAEPHRPYLLSLAVWGLYNGSEGDWPEKDLFVLQEGVNLLFGRHPRNVLEFFLSRPGGPSKTEQEADLLSELENAENPQQAAAYVLNKIYSG